MPVASRQIVRAEPAATIILLRDSALGPEVLVMQRNRATRFAGGALVFPGGKLDRSDWHPRMRSYITGARGVNAGDLAHRVGCIRELFEETGILLARRRGRWATERLRAQIDHAYRRRIENGSGSLAGLATDANLKFPLDQLTLFAHWITPTQMSRRFDTKFYLAAAPAHQRAIKDGWEAVELDWLRPTEVIALANSGKLTLMFPTRLNLMKLARANSVRDAIARARRELVVTVLPRLLKKDGEIQLLIPIQAGYEISVAEPWMLPPVERAGILGQHILRQK